MGTRSKHLNYAADHWIQRGENLPVGIILCAGNQIHTLNVSHFKHFAPDLTVVGEPLPISNPARDDLIVAQGQRGTSATLGNATRKCKIEYRHLLGEVQSVTEKILVRAGRLGDIFAMGTRDKLLMTLVLIAGLALVGWLLLRSDQPVYHGRTLYSWILLHAKSSDPGYQDKATRQRAEAAIRHIGTNALPTFLDWLKRKPSALERETMALIRAFPDSKVLQWLCRHDYHLLLIKDYPAAASYGFRVLGSAAEPAVPGLVKLLTDEDPRVRSETALCLWHIGPASEQAIPALMQSLEDPSSRDNALAALQAIGSPQQAIVPVLVAHLSSTNLDRQLWAIGRLSQMGNEAGQAVPRLVQLLGDPNPQVRTAATNLLKAIDAQAAARAGVK